MKSTTLVRSGAVAAVAALAAVGGAANSQAVTPGRDGAVSFGRSGQIWTAVNTASGVSQRQLTTSGKNTSARWSPDGRTIVYVNGRNTLMTMKANGSGKRTILASGGLQPSWQPMRGAAPRIAYVHVVNGRGDIYSMPQTGGAKTRLTTDGAANCGNSYPAFSANGTWFAYLQGYKTGGTCKGAQRVVIVNRTTGAKRVASSYPLVDQGVSAAVVKSRIEFTAGSTNLVVPLHDTDCYDNWAIVRLSGGFSSWENFRCEENQGLAQLVPTPSGNWARVTSYWDWSTLVMPTWGEEADSGSWVDIDVQPIR